MSTGWMSHWARRMETAPAEESSDLQLWVTRQHELARSRRSYHDKLAWQWLLAACAIFAISLVEPFWGSVRFGAFAFSIISGAIAFANWNEARVNAIAAETWPQDY